MKGKKTGARTADTPNKSKAVAYSEEVAEILCERLANSTDTLAEVCKEPGMPSVRSVFNWKSTKPEFAARFREAEERHARTCFDEALRVAKDRSGDQQVIAGKLQTNHSKVQRDRLIVDVLLKRASKMLPLIFGDLQRLEHTGKDGQPIESREGSNVELARWMQFTLNTVDAKVAAQPLALPAPEEPVITVDINPAPEPVEVKRQPRTYEHFGSFAEQGLSSGRRPQVRMGRR